MKLNSASKKVIILFTILIVIIGIYLAITFPNNANKVVKNYMASQSNVVGYTTKSIELAHRCCDQSVKSNWNEANFVRYTLNVKYTDGTEKDLKIDLSDSRPEEKQFGSFGEGLPRRQQWVIEKVYQPNDKVYKVLFWSKTSAEEE